MEFRLRPLGFMEVFEKKKLHETQGSQSKFHELNIYIYMCVCVCVCVCDLKFNRLEVTLFLDDILEFICSFTVKWFRVAPSPTPWCSSYRKGSLRVTLDYGRQLFTYLSI